MVKVSFIGCGNMGFAIAKALSDTKDYEITLYSPNLSKTQAKADEIGAIATDSLSSALDSSSLIILAVKPQVLPSLYKELKCAKGKTFISIAAGIKLETLKENLGTDKVIRFMPNLAASEKASVTAYTYLDNSLEEIANKVASSFGSAFYLPESQFSAFIGISGSAIAYVFSFIHALALGGTEAGIPYQTAVNIATDTLLSAVRLECSTKENPISLMSKVCSAGGTTIEGVHALEKGAFTSTVMNAVLAATNKNIKLETK